jgi:hypothetical protein
MLGLLMAFVPDDMLKVAVDATFVGGIVGVMSGEILRFIPTLRPYLKFLRTLGYILLVAGVYFEGSYTTEMEWRKKVADMQAKVVVAEQKAKTANVEIQTKVITKIQKIHDTKVITKQVLKEKQVEIDKCNVPDVITVLNKAATKPVLDLSLPPLDVETDK